MSGAQREAASVFQVECFRAASFVSDATSALSGANATDDRSFCRALGQRQKISSLSYYPHN
jgi:hypothetical protein